MVIKCVCVISVEIVEDVIRILVEKFCLDMKMFLNLNYFFYEVYLNGGKKFVSKRVCVWQVYKFYVWFFVMMGFQ